MHFLFYLLDEIFRYYVLLVPDISLLTLYHMKEYIQKVYNLGMQSNLIYDDSELQNIE